MHLVAISLHPVKSTAIRPVAKATLEPWGFVDDRRWMVIDDEGRMVSARTDDRLFTITARTRAIDHIAADLELSAPGHPTITVRAPTGAERPVRIFDRLTTAVVADEAANRWIGAVLGRDDVRLAYDADPTTRAGDPDHGRPGDVVSFADGYPVLIIGTASLDRLNGWIAQTARELGEPEPEPLPMARFRPNLTIATDEPFAEDRWRRIRIGTAELRVVKPCARCVMTTIDPQTLRHAKEPIRTLARYRREGAKTLFGDNAIPEVTGTIAVGDEVSVLA